MKKLVSCRGDVAAVAAARQLRGICARAGELGVAYEDMAAACPALQRVRMRARGCTGPAAPARRAARLIPVIFFVLLASLCAACVGGGGLMVYARYLAGGGGGLRPALQLWAEHVLGRGSLEEAPCALRLPDVIKDLVRPPVPSCAFCQNMSRVDVAAGLIRRQFEERYAYSGRPLLVLDAARHWSAVDSFSFDYLKSLYADTPPDAPVLSDQASNTNCQFFPYATEFANLSQVFAMSPERYAQPWYIGWSNCDSRVANALRQHYRKPYFLPSESESSRLDWIFMGRPGLGAFMHIDNVERPSWQAQVRGVKSWTLEPPPECYFQCEGARDGIYVTVRPGEVIVLDTNIWYHQTEVAGPDLSIVIGSDYD